MYFSGTHSQSVAHAESNEWRESCKAGRMCKNVVI